MLIHGGAGGVGLAALQIAQQRGARVIATAGIAGEARACCGCSAPISVLRLPLARLRRRGRGGYRRQGVDVVLNSLAGEAMERSLQAAEAVRPLRRARQARLLRQHAASACGRSGATCPISASTPTSCRCASRSWPGGCSRELDRLFAEGALTPAALSRVRRPTQAEDAFRLMQHVRPYRQDRAHAAARAAGAAPAGRFAVEPATAPTSSPAALGGFGLATARWLAEHGAQTSSCASPPRPLGPRSKAEAERLRARGVTVAARALRRDRPRRRSSSCWRS